jgi:hypothetical protein
MQCDYGDWDLSDACAAVERRLPSHVRDALANVRVSVAPAGFQGYADAGPANIRVRAGLHCSTAAMVAIVAHEAAHVYLQHAQQLRAGLKSVEACEWEADQLVLVAWGFDREMADRRLFFGR